MKTIKKGLQYFLIITIVISCVACASPGKKNEGAAYGFLDPKNPVTVTLWHYYVGANQIALESAVSQFNSTIGVENGVIVEAVGMGSITELEEAITASAKGVIGAEAMPQLFSSYPDKAMEIDSYDMVVELEPYFTDQEKAYYVDDFLKDGVFDEDRLLLIPIVKSTELMYINATGWEEFAASEGFEAADLASWESIYETAKAYYEWADSATAGVVGDGKALMGFDSVANYIIIGNKQLGVDVIDSTMGESSGAVLSASAMRRVFELYYKGMSLGYFGAVSKFRSDDIKAGNMIAYVGSSSSAAYFPTWLEKDNVESPIDFMALTYPVFSGGNGYAIQQGAGMCVARSTPAQQEGAVLFLKWFTEAQQNIDFAMTTGYLPVSGEAFSSQQFADALVTLRQGEKAQQNVADVYEIALRQITEANTYAAKPFIGSYDVRSILQSTLLEVTDAGISLASGLRSSGAGEEDILNAIKVDESYAEWIAKIKTALDDAGIAYTDTN